MASICKNPSCFKNQDESIFKQGKPVESMWLPTVKTLCRENRAGEKLCIKNYWTKDNEGIEGGCRAFSSSSIAW